MFLQGNSKRYIPEHIAQITILKTSRKVVSRINKRGEIVAWIIKSDRIIAIDHLKNNLIQQFHLISNQKRLLIVLIGY